MDVKAIIRQLKYDGRSLSRRKRAIRTFDLVRMSAHWDLEKEKDRRIGTMYNMAQQGLLKSGEPLSGLTTEETIWTGEGANFDLELERIKTLLERSSLRISY